MELENVIDELFDRSILTVPWIELGGMVTITCPKTGYSAQIDFETKVCSLTTCSCLYPHAVELSQFFVAFPASLFRKEIISVMIGSVNVCCGSFLWYFDIVAMFNSCNCLSLFVLNMPKHQLSKL